MTARRLFFSRAGLALAALLLPALLTAAALTPAAAQDTSEFFLRLNRLENQVRELAGTVEKLQFENRRLQEQLQRFQEDVEFRFQESGGGGQGAPAQPPAKQKRSDLVPGVPQTGGAEMRQEMSREFSQRQEIPQTSTPALPASSISAGADSAGAVPAAPPAVIAAGVPDSGAPLLAMPRIDTPAVSLPVEPVGAGRPLDLGAVAGAGRTATAGAATAAPVSASAQGNAAAAGIPSVAATAPGDPQVGYRNAEASLRRQDYWAAEMAFREFLQSHPRDRLVPDATFYLGESYYFRGRYREAAEQYLRLTTTHAASPFAPQGMLKLGMSLDALGARDQACATLAETIRKFPEAGSDVREGIARARAHAQCS